MDEQNQKPKDAAEPKPPSPPPQPLDYAPAPPRRRKWIRRGAWMVFILIVGLSTWRWGPRAWMQVQILYWQRQCMNYTAPADQVVYEEEPSAVRKLEAADRQYIILSARRQPGPTGAIWGVHVVGFLPRCWMEFKLLHSRGLPNSSIILFLHERTSPSGKGRLVCVQYFPDPTVFTRQLIEGLNVVPFAIVPAGLSSVPKPMHITISAGVTGGSPKTPPSVRIFAGQPDPADPSHFTIRYQMWGQEDVLDGRLGDDDRVTLEPRKLPQAP